MASTLTFEVGEKTYTLEEHFNSYCELERRSNRSTGVLISQVLNGHLLAARDLLWCQLQRHHAAEFPTVESVGVLVDTVGLDTLTQYLIGMGSAPSLRDATVAVEQTHGAAH